MNNQLQEIWKQCEETGNYAPLARQIRDQMNRVCGIGNPLPETVQEVIDKNSLIARLDVAGRLDEAILIAEELARLTESEYGEDSSEFGQQLEKLGRLYLKNGETKKARECTSEALFTLANAASLNGDSDIAAWYREQWQKVNECTESSDRHACQQRVSSTSRPIGAEADHGDQRSGEVKTRKSERRRWFGRGDDRVSSRRNLRFADYLVISGVLSIVVALLFPAIQAAREASRRLSCGNNMTMIELGVHQYLDAHLGLPPGTGGRNTDGRGPILSGLSDSFSWQAMLLPYLSHQDLYDQIDFSVAANDDANVGVASSRLGVFECASDPNSGLVYSGVLGRAVATNYVACRGAEVLKPEYRDTFAVDPRNVLGSITDGTSEAIQFSECMVARPFVKNYLKDPGEHVRWLDGKTTTAVDKDFNERRRGRSWFSAVELQDWSFTGDLLPNDQRAHNHECYLGPRVGFFGARSYHPGGVVVAFESGSVRFVTDDIDDSVWMSLATARPSFASIDREDPPRTPGTRYSDRVPQKQDRDSGHGRYPGNFVATLLR